MQQPSRLPSSSSPAPSGVPSVPPAAASLGVQLPQGETDGKGSTGLSFPFPFPPDYDEKPSPRK